MIKEEKISKFLNDLSAATPTPGGGAAAATTGAIAASLVGMVANLTINKKGYEKVRNRIKEISGRSLRLQKELIKLADKDSLAFEKVMQAYRSKNDRIINTALKIATEIPLKTAELSNQVNLLAKEIEKIGNKNAKSDALSALYLAKAATFAAFENVKINLDAITDKKFKEKVEKRIKDLNLPNCRCE